MPTTPSPAGQNLVALLRSPEWIAGACTLPLPYLLSLAYARHCQAEGLQEKSLKGLASFERAFGAEAELVVQMFHYMRQVQNGGHSQWFVNGFATDEWDGLRAANVDMKKRLLERFAQAPGFSGRPVLVEAMQLCRRAHPTMDDEEFVALDYAFYDLADAFQVALEEAAAETWPLGVEMVADEDERWERGQAFVDGLFGGAAGGGMRFDPAMLQRLNEVSRAFDALMKIPTLEEVAARAGLPASDIERVYLGVKGMRMRDIAEEVERLEKGG